MEDRKMKIATLLIAPNLSRVICLCDGSRKVGETLGAVFIDEKGDEILVFGTIVELVNA
jgi:hypothetical protein